MSNKNERISGRRTHPVRQVQPRTGFHVSADINSSPAPARSENKNTPPVKPVKSQFFSSEMSGDLSSASAYILFRKNQGRRLYPSELWVDGDRRWKGAPWGDEVLKTRDKGKPGKFNWQKELAKEKGKGDTRTRPVRPAYTDRSFIDTAVQACATQTLSHEANQNLKQAAQVAAAATTSAVGTWAVVETIKLCALRVIGVLTGPLILADPSKPVRTDT